MARYIDAETALKIIDNYAKTVTADGKVVVDAIRDIVGVITPTADVVPKSELEIWKQNRFNIFQRIECYEMTRKKVAREIFEEIESHSEDIGFSSFMERREFTDWIAELKKKYTEEE